MEKVGEVVNMVGLFVRCS